MDPDVRDRKSPHDCATPDREKSFRAMTDRILAENRRRREAFPPDFYSLMRPANLFIATQRKRALLNLLRRQNIVTLRGLRILDVGCGTGDWLLDFLTWDAVPDLLAGIDIDPDQVRVASRRLPSADLRVGNAASLPWPDGHFDIVLQATLFSSILDDDFKRAIASEMLRVAKPHGVIIWYDSRFNSPWNRHFRAIGAREIKTLFPGCRLGTRRTTLLPPLARRLVPLSWVFASLLEKLFFLRTHILACMRLPGPVSRRGARTPLAPRAACSKVSKPESDEIRYSPMARGLAGEVAELHALCFRDFFLTSLGRQIMARYYSHYCGRRDGICFIASSSSGRVIGLVAGSRNYGEFLRSFYRAHFFPLTLAIIKAFFRGPDLREKIRQRTPQIKTAITAPFLRRLPSDPARRRAELAPDQVLGFASLAVHPDFRKKGVAMELYRLFEERARELGVRRIESSVLVTNAPTIAFNKKVGLQIVGQDEHYLSFEKML